MDSLYLDTDEIAWRETPYAGVRWKKLAFDRETGRSRGFGFVEMSDDNAAMKAIEGVNGKDVDGRTLNVNEARPREPEPVE